MATPPVRYFAYGSNMLTDRLRERVPSATAIGIGRLGGHELRWDKRSGHDGSGKCDAEATGRQEDVVWGVVFELDPDEKPALDRAEGLGAGYMDKTVQVSTDAGPVTAVMYYAIDKDPSLGLPPSYRSRLELVVTVSDHNPTRAGTSGDPLSGPRRTS